MKKEITEEDVRSAKNSTRALLEDEEIELSYITAELLSLAADVESSDSSHDVYYGNRIFNTSDGQTGQALIGFYGGTSLQEQCGERLITVPQYVYIPRSLGRCNGGFPSYSIAHV